MPKYYYTDPLKAAWMVREFNIKLQDTNSKEIRLCKGILNNMYAVAFEVESEPNSWEECNQTASRFYIHPDCHEMLKPQVGDIFTKKNNNQDACVVLDFDEDIKSLSVLYRSIENSGSCRQDFIKIIQRNRKAFFVPEVEHE